MAYALKYYKEFTRNHGTHRLEIHEKDYTGSSTEIDNLQGDILITMDGSDITDAIIGSTLTFTLIDTSQIDYTQFFTPDSTKYKVVFKTNNTTRWTGYLTPDSYKENLAYREPITLTARDNTGRLNDFYFNEDMWQMMSISDILALARTTAGIDMPMSLNTQLYAGNTRAILTLINTTAFHNSTWREVVEKILSGIGCQMRWCDNNYIGIYDLSQLYDLDAEGVTQSMRFISKSGYKEIKPAWRQLDITQDYQSRQNLYNSSDYLNESDYENMGTRTNYADIIAGKSWVAVNDGTIIGKEVQISNQWGYANDDQQKSIYIGVFHYCQIIDHINLGYNPNYVKLSKKIYRANKENVIIKFYANCTLRGVNLTPTQMDGELNLLKPTLSTTSNHYNFNKYTLQIYCNIIYTQVAGSTYILRKEWEVYDEAEPASNDDYLIFPLDENDWDTGYVNVDKEISIYIDTLPFADTSSGTLELRLYPVWADEYEPYGCCKISNFDISIGTSIKAGQHKRTTVNSEHNINQAIGVCIGQVPDDKVTSDNYLGGLFNEDSNALHPAPQSWKLDSTSQTTYNLLELVAREHIHFNKDNYLLLSGQMIPETLTDYIHFDRPFLYSATRYVPISFDYNAISNSINVTKMQEVREYEVEELTFEDITTDDTGNSGSSSGGSSSGGSSGTTDHSRLANRDTPDQHPISAINGLSDSLLSKLDITTFSDLFEKVNIGTTESPIYVIRAKYNFSSIGWITARGYNSESGGGGGSSYSRLDAWADYDASKSGWVLSALLGNNLNTRVSALESNTPNVSWGNSVTGGFGLNINGVSKNVSLVGHTHYNYLSSTLKGAVNGLAELDANGLVPSSQLPSYVDDVIECSTLNAFPATGETGKIYVAKDTNITYRWGGSSYVEISASLALGETSSTAYRGDRGKTAYDHSQLSNGSNPHATTFANIVGKPSTYAPSAHTHAISDVTNLSTSLAAKLNITTFSDLFEKVNVGTAASPIYAIQAKYNLYSLGWVSARGYNSDSGGGSSDYTRLDTWTGYNNSTMAGYVLSAGLGYDMVTRIASLESGSALSLVTSGSGNAVTSVTKSGTEISIVKGSTFSLSGHNHDAAYVPTTRTIAGLALSADVGVSSLQNALGLGTAAYTASTSYAAASHTHTKAQITDFPTSLPASDVYAWAKAATKPSYTTSEVSEGSNLYFTDARAEASITQARVEGVLKGLITSHTHNYLPLTGGTINGTLTVKHDPFAGVPSLRIGGPNRYLNLTGNAVTFDMSADSGVWASSLLSVKDPVSTTTGFGIYGGTVGLYYYYMGGTYSSPICKLYPSNRFEILKSGSIIPETTNIYNLGSASIKWANVYATTFIGALSGNASSATKLQTSRTIWGQSFDGTGNVSGAMTGVSTISASGNITTNGNITSVGYITSQSYITARVASDIRLKENVKTIYNGLSIIRQLRPIEADWNSIAERLNPHDHKGHLASFIAQEYMNVLPFAAKKMSDGYYGIDNTAVIPYLTSAVKEIDNEVTTLKKRVEYLEKELKKYKAA